MRLARYRLTVASMSVEMCCSCIISSCKKLMQLFRKGPLDVVANRWKEGVSDSSGYPGFEDLSEDPKSTAVSTATGTHRGSTASHRPGSQGQRPDSSGQPQAMGSRGTMFGSLGETEPPSDSYRP